MCLIPSGIVFKFLWHIPFLLLFLFLVLVYFHILFLLLVWCFHHVVLQFLWICLCFHCLLLVFLHLFCLLLIISPKKNNIKRKDFLLKPIISQKLINVLKNKIFNIISLDLFNNVEFLINNLFTNELYIIRFFPKLLDINSNSVVCILPNVFWNMKWSEHFGFTSFFYISSFFLNLHTIILISSFIVP